MIDLPLLPPLVTTGSVLRREALALGLNSAEVERLVRQGAWVRIRPGAYAERGNWMQLTPEQQHLVRAKAVLRALAEPAALAHVSAAVAHGLPVWNADLSVVHVVRPARRHGARIEAGVAHHSAQLPAEHLSSVDGVPVTSLARTVLDHSRSACFEPAVVTADAALHGGAVTPEMLREVLFWMRDWPGARAAGRAIAFADPRAETVGESRGRVFCHLQGLPTPELQVEIVDEFGVLLARVDFLFDEQRTVAEFDGRVKYRGDATDMPAGDVVWLEKVREDAVRAQGYEVVRFYWADFDRPRQLMRRFTDAFARGAARSAA
jgi:DNA-binding MarR family transcriptional regulator